MIETLLPCPFCSNDGTCGEALHVSHSEHDWREDSYVVQCDRCAASTGYFITEDEAVDAWNTRAPTRADVLVDALGAEAEAAYAAHAEKRIAVLEAFRDAAITRIAVLEAERDAALATLAAARAMLSATGAALAEATKRIMVLEAALRGLYRGYINTLENGRDRIIFLGGECDPVDRMEEGDPSLIAARVALEPKP